MTARAKQRPRVIHCHGCEFAVNVQFSTRCPRPGCGFVNGECQEIDGDFRCSACGVEVDAFTELAALTFSEQFQWEDA